jgi:hypothetical protein
VIRLGHKYNLIRIKTLIKILAASAGGLSAKALTEQLLCKRLKAKASNAKLGLEVVLLQVLLNETVKQKKAANFKFAALFQNLKSPL